MPGVNTAWREVAEAIVRVYTQRTNGSFMQKKGSSIVWNHQQAVTHDVTFDVTSTVRLLHRVEPPVRPTPAQLGVATVTHTRFGCNGRAASHYIMPLHHAIASCHYIISLHRPLHRPLHLQADPEFGAMQARELQYHLQGVLTAFPVVVRVGKGYVEACPKGINKGAMAERMIEESMAQVKHSSGY